MRIAVLLVAIFLAAVSGFLMYTVPNAVAAPVTKQGAESFVGYTDESGYTVVTHQLGFTPTQVFVELTTPYNGFTEVDQKNESTFRVRVMRPYNNAPYFGKIAFDWIAVSNASTPVGVTGGFAMGSMYQGGSGANLTETDFAAVAATHASYARYDVDWWLVEGTKGVFNWAPIDRMFNAAKNNNLESIMLIHRTPTWANNGAGPYAPATNDADLQNFCQKVVERYGPQGAKLFEVGNEVNLPDQGRTPNAATYVNRFLKPAAVGIRAANGTVLFAGLAPGDGGGTAMIQAQDFVQQAYAAGAKAYFDAMNYHPYSGDMPQGGPVGTPGYNISGRVAAIRQSMNVNGDSAKVIWGSEYGVPTGGSNSVTEARQAEHVQLAYTTWNKNENVAPLLWFSPRDKAAPGGTERENYFGVMRSDGTKKPAYATLTNLLVRKSSAVGYSNQLSLYPTFEAAMTDFESMVGKRPQLVMWFRSWWVDHFPAPEAATVDSHGQIPMITWMSDKTGASNAAIIAGTFDSYIDTWAKEIKAYNKPVWLRLDHEMNGNWYPWTGPDFIPMWKHVVDRFRALGVSNVKWVWAPNVVCGGNCAPIADYYPGNDYVDIVGLDGYNRGTSQTWSHWQTFSEIFGESIKQVKALAPGKPFWVCETGSVEAGGNKAAWITDMFQQVKKLDGVIWFNYNKDTNWLINSSPESLAAFKAGV